MFAKENWMPRILVTGASSGIGRAVVERFAREGWAVLGTVRSPEKFIGEPWPGYVRLVRLDLDCEGCGANLAQRVLAEHGCPDVVVNNAGMLQFGPIENASAEEISRIFRVNVFEQVALAYGFVPEMRGRGSGTIVNVSSLGGLMTFPFFGVYNGTKHALEGMSEGMWHELKPFGIQVKLIEPGFVDTAIWGKVLPDSPEHLDAPPLYAKTMAAMMRFEAGITKRSSAEETAEEIWRAINDPSDRLRYPVAAYARPILAARRILGDRALMRFFHRQWLGKKS